MRLLNGGAVCNMRMGQWKEAESQLLEAFEKDAKNADTLANLITVSLHLSKPASRYSGCVFHAWPLADLSVMCLHAFACRPNNITCLP